MFVTICLSLLFCGLYAQESVKFIDVKNDRIPILVDGEWEIMDHYKVLNLLEDNIYSFFGLHDKYRSAFCSKRLQMAPKCSIICLFLNKYEIVFYACCS